MRRQKVLVVTLLALLIIPSVTIPIKAEERFDEELGITVVGSTALWKVKYTGINVSSLGISSIDNIPGIQDFELLYVRYETPDPKIELFKSQGYDVIGFDLLPQKGAMLRVKASSLESAFRLASTMETPLQLGFIYIRSNGENHYFYSYAEIGRVDEGRFGPMKVWNFLQAKKGLNRLSTTDTFLIDPMPMLSLAGKKAGGTFVYSVAVGGVAYDAVKEASLKFSNIFRFANGMNASANARNSTFELRLYGGIIQPSEKYSMEYIPDMRSTIVKSAFIPKENRSRFDFTVIPSPPILVVTRSVDKSAIAVGESLEYRIRFENPAPKGSGPLSLFARETWWQQHFDAVRGGDQALNITKLEPGESKTFVYVLRARTSTQTVASPSESENTFTYSYKLVNKNYTGTTRANELNILLNRAAPALVAEGFSSNYLPSSPNNETAVLLIRNGGTQTAFNVKAYLGDKLIETLPSVAPDPLRPARVSVPLPLDSFQLRKRDLSWRVEWAEGERSQYIRSNVFSIFENYTKPEVPRIVPEKTSTYNKTRNVYETIITVKNNTTKSLASLEITDYPPRGTAFTSGDLSVSGQVLFASINNLGANASRKLSYVSNGPAKLNLITGPAILKIRVGDVFVERLSKSIIAPNAVVVEKTLKRTTGLIGYNFTVDLSLKNEGSESLFTINAEGVDSPLRPVRGKNSASRNILAPSETLALNYDLQTFRGQNISLIGARVIFTLAGSIQEIRTNPIPMQIYDAPQAKVKFGTNTFLDNREFGVTVEISNPSPFTIDQLSLSAGESQNFKVLSGDLAAGTVRQLSPGQTITITLTAVSPEPNKEMKFIPKATHTFDGQTITIHVQTASTIVNEDVAARFGLPATLGIAIVIATWVLARRYVESKKAAES